MRPGILYCGYNWKSDDSGVYTIYLPKGQYEVNGTLVTVKNKNLTVNLGVAGDTSGKGAYEVCGDIRLREGIAAEKSTLSNISVYNSKGEAVANCCFDDDGKYYFYIGEPGEYILKNSQGIVLDTISVADTVTKHDVVLNLYEISGMFNVTSDAQWLRWSLEDSDGNSVMSGWIIRWDSTFSVYVNPGVYTLKSTKGMEYKQVRYLFFFKSWLLH